MIRLHEELFVANGFRTIAFNSTMKPDSAMKTLTIGLLTFLILLHSQGAEGQTKKVKTDTIYYLLDTAAIPVKDQMFKTDREGRAMGYSLNCRCYPYGTNIFFYFDIYLKKEENITQEKFKTLKTVSLIELIDIAIKCLAPSEYKKYAFVFVQPDGANMKATQMTLGPAYKPRKTITSQN